MLTDALTIAPAGWTVLQVRTCASLEFVDLTERLASLACGVSSGVMHVFTRHTTTGLLVNVAPGERVNGHAHCRAALFRSSESVPIVGGALCLGRWQRVLLAEFDGPQMREVMVMLTSLRR